MQVEITNGQMQVQLDANTMQNQGNKAMQLEANTAMKPFCPSVFLSQTACSAKFSKATNYASLNSCSSELVKPIAGRQVTDTSLQLQMTSRVLEESSHEKYTLYHASIFN